MESYSLEHLMRSESFVRRCPWDISPDGRFVSVSISVPERREPLSDIHNFTTRSGVGTEANGARLVIVDTESGETIVPFADAAVSYNGRWSPDGNTLGAYVADEGVLRIGLWDRFTGHTRVLNQPAIKRGSNIIRITWTPDSKNIVDRLVPQIDNLPPDPSEADVLVRAFNPETEDADTLPREFLLEHLDRRMDLGVVDVESGTIERLGSAWHFTMVRMSPDGRAIVAIDNRINTPGVRHSIGDIVVVPLDGSSPHIVVSDVPINDWACRVSWSPDGQSLCYVTGGRGEEQGLWLVPVDGSAPPEPLLREDFAVGSYQTPWWTPDGEHLVWLQDGVIQKLSLKDLTLRQHTSEHLRVEAICHPFADTVLPSDASNPVTCIVFDRSSDSRHIARLHLDSGETDVIAQPAGDGADEFMALSSSNSAFVHTHHDGMESLVRCHLEIGSVDSLHMFNPWRTEVNRAVPVFFTFRDMNGREQEASVFMPSDRWDGTPPPLVAIIYPGGKDARINPDEPEVQLLTGMGYAVLYADLVMEDTDPTSQIPGVVLPAVNRAVELGYADRNRLGVMGHSYGGYGVLVLLTRTDMFRAAVAASPGGVNMSSMYTAGSASLHWCEGWQARLGGTPWECRDAYIEASPFFAFDRITTPVLLTRGEKDEICGQSTHEAFIGLRKLGKRVEERTYRGEEHNTRWSAAGTRDYHTRVIEWFDMYMRPSRNEAI
jgi:dipeptidyl aminopeptidase/acylaminoacyl peptidase